MTVPLAFGACAILTPGAAARAGRDPRDLAGPGLCDSYQVGANAAFVAAVPDDRRSQAFGLAIAGMQLGQGPAMILAGVMLRTPAPGWPSPCRRYPGSSLTASCVQRMASAVDDPQGVFA